MAPSQAMPTLIELMKDPSVVVRDTTAWTVGRICEMLPEAAINDIYLAPLLQCLMEGLSAEPRVATNVCWVRRPPNPTRNSDLLGKTAPAGIWKGFVITESERSRWHRRWCWLLCAQLGIWS